MCKVLFTESFKKDAKIKNLTKFQSRHFKHPQSYGKKLKYSFKEVVVRVLNIPNWVGFARKVKVK